MAKTANNRSVINALLLGGAFGALAAGGAQAQIVVSGEVTPSPAASPVWTVPYPGLTVGGATDGHVSVTNGASLLVASDDDSDIRRGTVTVSGAGSRWQTGRLSVGRTGLATVTFGPGAVVTSASGVIGASSSGQGKVVVSGANWAIDDRLSVGDTGAGSLTLSNGGVVTASSPNGAHLGDNNGSGVLNIGGERGQAAAAAGFLRVNDLFIGQTSELNFNYTDATYVFTVRMRGRGAINQWTGRTILRGDSVNFDGRTTVYGGTLVVDGISLRGNLTVMAGGRLEGEGRLGSVTVGGAIAPGPSTGLMYVFGGFNQLAGSTYEVDLTSNGASDRIVVLGSANLAAGSILKVTKTDAAPLVVGTRYTVVSTTGDVAGRYTLDVDGQGINYFVGLKAVYENSDVYLDVVQARTFASGGGNANEAAVGAALDGRAASDPLAAALLALPDEASARLALAQLAGADRASARSVLVADSRFAREAAIGRLRLAGDQPLTVWGDLFGARGTFDGGAQATTMKRDIGGLLFGVDAPAFAGWRLGLMAGYGRSDSKTRGRTYRNESDDYHLGVYGGRAFGALGLRGGAVYSWHDFSATRSVVFPGFSQALASGGDGRTTQAFAEIGYALPAGTFGKGAATLEPFASLAHVSLEAGGQREAGGISALAGVEDRTAVTFATVGARLSASFALGGDRSLTARGSLGWRRASGDVDPTATASFAAGPAFTVIGLPIEKDALAVETGLSAAVSSRLRLNLSYDGQFAGRSTDQSLRGGLALSF
ncbi:hypothetical protein CFHF_03475 [Caulobacter flavus]|uniref:Autotransporter domain-containing protein n=1 Tax=Caulobacter flavus TaxID=1679497 RepID=A0A2N5CZ37_9CAUL|nr:autotransporter domain-containing protein [Caulobacter flavus]AYV45238.1 hypothetical protein C1707_02695 [Caulobacter flavus]PLR19081.1 hypothetical protein CFHF_03475 [Caulobacter flavus]